MSINEITAKMWEVELLEENLCGLNEVYRDIADEIGIENAVVIYRLFHGTQISFPNRLFSKDYTHEAIVFVLLKISLTFLSTRASSAVGIAITSIGF